MKELTAHEMSRLEETMRVRIEAGEEVPILRRNTSASLIYDAYHFPPVPGLNRRARRKLMSSKAGRKR